MSIWGEADPNEIPNDPFRIEPNWYKAIATEIFVKDIENGEPGEALCTIKWKIQQSGGRFHKLPVTDRNTFFKRSNDELDGEQIQRNSFFKTKLRNGFDLDDEGIAGFTPREQLGKEAYIEVVNSPDKTNTDLVWNNVRGVLSPRLFNERFGSPDELDAETETMSMADL